MTLLPHIFCIVVVFSTLCSINALLPINTFRPVYPFKPHIHSSLRQNSKSPRTQILQSTIIDKTEEFNSSRFVSFRHKFPLYKIKSIVRKIFYELNGKARKIATSLFLVAAIFTSGMRNSYAKLPLSSETNFVKKGPENCPPKENVVTADKTSRFVCEIIASEGGSHETRKPVNLTPITKAMRSNNQNSRAMLNVEEAVGEVEKSLNSLISSLEGAKLDTLIMLIAISLVIPIFNKLDTSPIIGFLLAGTLLGPRALNWVRDIHMIDVLGELGIVFFLFEMGLELSFDRLKAMRRDVFGLGSSQFFVTAAAGTAIALFRGLPMPAAVTIGGSLSLSSSAFVLQLLKDKNAMGTRHGKSSFGILLLQDLAVVPLLVVVELLGEGGAGLGKALFLAGIKAVVTLISMSFLGKRFLDPVFEQVAKSRSEEAFMSIILTTVLLMSFVTKGIGLSDTLGAFLAGILLSETSYRYQIEGDIATLRGLLLGIFFITVGFNIDITLILSEAPKIAMMLGTMIIGKATIITLLSLAFGTPLASAQLCGLLNSQGGEFAFVSLGIAERTGIVPSKLAKMLMTSVALSMALTPMLADIGASISKKIESRQGLTHYTGKVPNAEPVVADKDFVFICGYGQMGKLVGDMLDRKFVRYIAVENSPQRAIDARNLGLPVYFGDINRPEMLKHFHVESAKACVITFDDISAINKAVIRLKKLFPELPIIVRAKNPQHQQRLESMFDNVHAVNPAVPEDSIVFLLPFGEAVLSRIGVAAPEIEAIVEDVRRVYSKDEDELEKNKEDGESNNVVLNIKPEKENIGVFLEETRPKTSFDDSVAVEAGLSYEDLVLSVQNNAFGSTDNFEANISPDIVQAPSLQPDDSII